MVPGAVIDGPGDREVGLVAVGSTDGAACEAMHILARRGIEVDYMRIRAFPFGKDVEAFLAAHRTVFVIEQNRDAQLRSLLTLETPVEKSKLRSILHYSGLSISSQVIVDGVLAELGEGRRPKVVAAVPMRS
jgi:2-oxoglutarate ferredoxin oxidoreductase subunit alpha